MTREKCKAMLPIIEAFANGETVEFYDSLNIKDGKRGHWRTADNIGFGARIESYRIVKKDGEIIYFGDRTKENINHDGL